MKKIVVNTRTLQSHLTGVQRYTKELLSRWGSDVDTVAPETAMLGIKGHAWEQLALPFRLNHSLLFSPSNTGPLSVSRQVVTIHDVVPMDHPEWLNPRFAAWYRFLLPRLSRRVGHIVTISDYTKQRIMELFGVSSDRVTVVLNGVDAKFRPLDNDAGSHLSSLNLPSKRYILSVGSVEPRKNLARLFDSWRLLLPKIPDDICLVITGMQGKREIFAQETAAGEMPQRVHLTGHVPDELLPYLYANAMIFAYPSVYEGFGLPPLEAMASGVPVLAGNLTSLPEVVGDAGIMVDPYDVESMADKLLELISDEALRSSLTMKGLERAKAFSWDDAASKTYDILMGI